MTHTSPWAKRVRLAGIVALFGTLTGFVLWSGNGKGSHPALGPRLGGDARLISIEPLPETDGPMCEMVPASASTSLFAELEQQQMESGPAGAPEAAESRPSEAAKETLAKRRPARMINDRDPAYAAVALDLAHDEVVLQDENTFSILTYNRLENTPPAARISEPKRIIRGEHALIEYNCSLYVDPVNGDIYSVDNDTLNLLTVYSHDAKGDVAPVRMLNAPRFFGIAVDEEHQELFLSSQNAMVVTFKKTAKGYDHPLRFIQGNHTQLADSHGMAMDSKRGLLFVANWGTTHQLRLPASNAIPWGDGASPAWGRSGGNGFGAQPIAGTGTNQLPSITVYPRDAMGDVAPLQVIQGPKTQLSWPTAIAEDAEHGELFVANDSGDSITVYSAEANGDVEPIRVIKGPKSLIKSPVGLAYDPKHDELWVANFGNHTATVFKRTATGDSPPLRVIRSAPLDTPAPMMSNPHTVVYDSKRDQLLVAD
jgi:hypothetical protein